MTELSEENILSRCPHCGNKIELPPDYLGDLIDCPECGKEYTVTAEPKEAVPAPVEEPVAEEKVEEKTSVPEIPAPAPAPAVEPKLSAESSPEPEAGAVPTGTSVAEKKTAIEAPSVQPSAPTPAPAEKPKAKKPNRVKTGDMIRKYSDDVSPDSLMTDFKPKGILIIAIFTIIVHVVLLGGSSFNYLKEKFITKPKELPEAERKTQALDAATRAINDIAEKYDLTSADVTSQFSATGSRADKVIKKSGDSKKLEKKPEKKPEDKPEEKPDKDPEKKLNFDKKEEGPEEFDFKDDF